MTPSALWDSVWLGGHIATLAPHHEAYGIIKNAAIAVRNGKICWLGKLRDLPPQYIQHTQNIYDFSKQWLTPGLIDCHTHLIYAGNRATEFEQRLQGIDYATIAKQGGGIQATVNATRQADADQLLQLASKRLGCLLREGVTTVEIKSGYGLNAENEYKLLRCARRLGEILPVQVRCTFLGAHAVPAELHGQADRYIDQVCDMLPEIKTQGLADAVDAFCETIAFTPAQVTRVFRTAASLGLPVKLHADQLSDSHGAKLAADFAALSADHLEYSNEHGIKALAAAGTVAVLLPAAFYFLREQQMPPLALLRRHQVPWALATDSNPGSAPVLSLLLILNMACTLWRVTPEEALLGVTRHAAMALGLGDSHGSLALGKVADFALWDIEHPAELAYWIGANPCVGRVLAGKPVITTAQ